MAVTIATKVYSNERTQNSIHLKEKNVIIIYVYYTQDILSSVEQEH